MANNNNNDRELSPDYFNAQTPSPTQSEIHEEQRLNTLPVTRLFWPPNAIERALECAANGFVIPGFVGHDSSVPIIGNPPAVIQDLPEPLAAAPAPVVTSTTVVEARRQALHLTLDALRLAELAAAAEPTATPTDATAVRLALAADNARVTAEAATVHADLMAARFRAESYAARGLLTLNYDPNGVHLVQPARVVAYYDRENENDLPQMLEAVGPRGVMLPRVASTTESMSGSSHSSPPGIFHYDSDHDSDMDTGVDPTEHFWAVLLQGL